MTIHTRKRTRPAELILGNQFGLVSVDDETLTGTVLLFRGGETRIRFTDSDQCARAISWITDGGLVQDLLPDMDADDRELMISGLTADEYPKGAA